MQLASMSDPDPKEPSPVSEETAPAFPQGWGSATEAIEQSPAGKKLVALARASWIDRAATPEEVARLAAELGIDDADAVTPLGNAIVVLARGPEDDAERTLGRALVSLALAEAWQAADADDGKLAGTAMALSAASPFDVLASIDRVMGDARERAWRAIAMRLRKFDRGEPGTARGEATVGCAALALSTSPAAALARKGLELKDPSLRALLAPRAASGEQVSARLSGELLPAPRNAALTALLAITGMLFVLHALRLVARLVLAYRTPAEITLSPTGVRIRAKTIVLGRTLRETETRIPRESLARATREVRFPRLGLYVGLFALAVGSYVGVSTLNDGVRASSITLLLTGLVIVAAGIGIDLLLTSAGPGARGLCRVLFVSSEGGWICVGGVDAARADQALDVLKA